MSKSSPLGRPGPQIEPFEARSSQPGRARSAQGVQIEPARAPRAGIEPARARQGAWPVAQACEVVWLVAQLVAQLPAQMPDPAARRAISIWILF